MPFVLNIIFAHSDFGKRHRTYECRDLPSGSRDLRVHVLPQEHGLDTMAGVHQNAVDWWLQLDSLSIAVHLTRNQGHFCDRAIRARLHLCAFRLRETPARI